MGTNYNGEEQRNGVIPRVMDTIFSKVETIKESGEFLIRVSFIEVSDVKFNKVVILIWRIFHISSWLIIMYHFTDFQGRGV